MVLDLEFTRGNATVARGTGAAGFVGVFNGMRLAGAADGGGGGGGVWSASINARGKGGALLTNLLQALMVHSVTPGQRLREVLTAGAAEGAGSFDGAVGLLSKGAQVLGDN